MSYKPTLFKKLKDEKGTILDLPKRIKIRGSKRSFCLLGEHGSFTPSLSEIVRRDKNGYLLTARTVAGPYIKIDIKSQKVSLPYVYELSDSTSTMVLTPDNCFVVLDRNLNAFQTGYKCVDIFEEQEKMYYIFKRGDVKPENEKFGIIGPEGDIICPPRFYTKDLKIEAKPGMFYLISSEAKNSKQVLTKSAGLSAKLNGAEVKINKVLLSGDKIVQLLDWPKYYNHSAKPTVPFYAVYNKQADSSDIFSYDKKEYKFEKIGDVRGRVTGAYEEEFYKKFYYFTDDGKGKTSLVSADGKVELEIDEIAKVEDIGYDELRRDEGRMIFPPYGISMHKTTEVPFVIFKDDKMGLFDTTLDRVMLAPEYNKILIATKTESGEGRFLVENDKKHFGVVDGKGKSIVPFTMTNFGAIKEIDFGQGKRFVAKMGIETRKGIEHVYIDPATESGLASEIEVNRLLESIGKKTVQKSEDNEREKE